MGTTDSGFPYPDAADPFAVGNEAIQALAEQVDLDLNQWAKLARISTQNLVTATPALVQWTSGDSDLTDDFELTTQTSTDDTLKYTGRPRFVAWRYGIKLPDALSSGLVIGIFRRRATATMGSDDYIVNRVDLADINSSNPVGDSGLVWMDTDSEWQVIAQQTTGSTRATSFWASFKAI